MVREVYSLEVMEEAGFVQIRVSGNGFLHNMVRKIVGALISWIRTISCRGDSTNSRGETT